MPKKWADMSAEERDAIVTEKVMGECFHEWVQCGPNTWNLRCAKCDTLVGNRPSYTTDIAAAWSVFKKVMERTFSVRQKYNTALTEIVRTRMGAAVAWPDLLMFVEPDDFGHAACIAMGAIED